MLGSIIQKDCPSLKVCGSQIEYQETAQYTSDERQRKQYRRAWRCKTCLNQFDKDIVSGNRLPVLTAEPQYIERTKELSKLIRFILNPETERVENEINQGIGYQAFDTCPWEWKYNPLCVAIMELHEDIMINPANWTPKALPAPLAEGYRVFNRARKATEAFWFKKAMEPKE